MSKLKPCPFCGHEVKIRYRQPLTFIYCSCGALMSVIDKFEQMDGKSTLIKLWNTRSKNNDSL